MSVPSRAPRITVSRASPSTRLVMSQRSLFWIGTITSVTRKSPITRANASYTGRKPGSPDACDTA